MVYLSDGILHSIEKEWVLVLYESMGKSDSHNERKKPNTMKYTLWDFIPMSWYELPGDS